MLGFVDWTGLDWKDAPLSDAALRVTEGPSFIHADQHQRIQWYNFGNSARLSVSELALQKQAGMH